MTRFVKVNIFSPSSPSHLDIQHSPSNQIGCHEHSDAYGCGNDSCRRGKIRRKVLAHGLDHADQQNRHDQHHVLLRFCPGDGGLDLLGDLHLIAEYDMGVSDDILDITSLAVAYPKHIGKAGNVIHPASGSKVRKGCLQIHIVVHAGQNHLQLL